MRKYLHYIGPALLTWAKGIRWLWTRQLPADPGPSFGHLYYLVDDSGGREVSQAEYVRWADSYGIHYKPGWGPWRFLPVYLTTYLAGTIAGYGVVSLSRAWYDRSCICAYANIIPGHCAMKPHYFSPAHPFARFMTRLLDWAFPGSAHGRHTGPRLWGVEGVR